MRLCPLQGTTHLARRRLAFILQLKTRPAAPLLESLAPSTHEPERIHSTPAYLTGYVPPTGFRTLSTDYSSLGRLALFRASSAHGVCRSPGGFPHYQRSTDSSPMHNPLDVLPRLHCVLHRNADRSVLAAPPYHIPKNVVAATPPSGHHSSSGSVFHARGFRPTVKSIPS